MYHPSSGDDETWAHRSSPTEISEYVAKYAMEVGKSVEPKQCGIDREQLQPEYNRGNGTDRRERQAHVTVTALHLAFSEGDGSSAVMRKKSIFKVPSAPTRSDALRAEGRGQRAGSGTINVQLGSHSHHNHQC